MKIASKVKSAAFLTVLFLAYVFLFVLYFAKMGDPITDCGREAFIPYRILNGEVLFRDIFCIYGPFAYYIGAILYKIFGQSLNVLYFQGGLLGLGVVYVVYFILREFLSRTLSFVGAFFVISVCAYNFFVFNFIFPYSFAMMWALLGFLLSLLFLIKYLKNPGEKYASFAMLFLGLSLSNKYEFLPFVLPVVLSFCFIKPLKHKRALLYFLVFPLISLLMMLLNGVTFADVLNNARYIDKMLKTSVLKHFYTYSAGTYFHKDIFLKVISSALRDILAALTLFYVTLFCGRLKNRFLKGALLFVVFFVSLFVLLEAASTIYGQFVFFPMMFLAIVIYLLVSGKFKNWPYFILILSAFLASLKYFHCMSLGVYGTYPLTILMPALFVFLYRTFLSQGFEKRWVSFSISFFALVFSLLVALHCFFVISSQRTVAVENKMDKSAGKIFTSKKQADEINFAIDYIFNNTDKKDTVFVLPEGQMLNFLTRRPAGLYYDSLTPLYFETFGDEKIVQDFQRTGPVYVIVFTDRTTSEYGKSVFCADYGQALCSYIKAQYRPVAAFGESVFIYKNEKLKGYEKK